MSAPPYFSSRRRRSPSTASGRGAEDIPGQISSPSPVSRAVAASAADSRLLSSSASSAFSGHREPTRSFIPGPARDILSPVDSAGFARSVREDTAELASYVLSDKKDKRNASFLNRRLSGSQVGRESSLLQHDPGETETSSITSPIREEPEPPSPQDELDDIPIDGPSMISNMLKRSPPQILQDVAQAEEHASRTNNRPTITLSYGSIGGVNMRDPDDGEENESSERTPLLRTKSTCSQPPDSPGSSEVDELSDIESQKPRPPRFDSVRKNAHQRISIVTGAINPKTWDVDAAWEHVVMKPIRCIPAVVVGLLLNVLDALSYGLILFPLGNPVFANLGPAGISIFYVSTIISQLTFSSASIFKGGVGSELIEVVPFFHSMAATITAEIGEDQPDAVIATTITSYAISSMLTGVVFYLMGFFRLGYIVGFIPRHILIGCIGGVGWFLVATGFEVSARLDDFRYDLDTAQKLIQLDTLPHWMIPLALAILLYVLQKKVTSQYLVSMYIISLFAIFYFFVLSFDTLVPEQLRADGWIFEAPAAGEPWWYFWTLYKFNLVHWGAIFQNVGTMFALTFFSLLHVPINVPALAQSTKEDNANLDRELKLHGYSNFLSGCVGSIQNYLVYANTLMFMRSGGNSRLAGFMLAACTMAIMMCGPVIIGFIPVIMVGTLIFNLGFELLADSLVTPRPKLKLLEYVTILAIVLTMGIYDFVAGIFLGIILAFVTVVVNQSGVSAIRATYTGDQVGSMVRRNPSQYNYLKEVGRQTFVIKLFGNLFFGTIVGVQERIRALITDEAFEKSPIRYLIIDFSQVTSIDYSAAEGFMTISRLLSKKKVVLLISGIDAEGKIGRDLRAVGLGEEEHALFMPDLNSALESCENEQLKAYYTQQQEVLRVTRPSTSSNLDVPESRRSPQPLDYLSQSPRRKHLDEVAKQVIEHEMSRRSRWRTISEPLRLMLQIFHDISEKNEDFWFRAKPYFKRREFLAGTVLYRRGEPANGFYLLESGELRADYETPQGKLSEPIVQGTTCGELPFFSRTNRTATVVAVKNSVVWVMDTESWERLQKEENDVSQELLSVSLKLTTERMNAMTNYTLANAN